MGIGGNVGVCQDGMFWQTPLADSFRHSLAAVLFPLN
jgi:hypothetical protein